MNNTTRKNAPKLLSYDIDISYEYEDFYAVVRQDENGFTKIVRDRIGRIEDAIWHCAHESQRVCNAQYEFYVIQKCGWFKQ